MQIQILILSFIALVFTCNDSKEKSSDFTNETQKNYYYHQGEKVYFKVDTSIRAIQYSEKAYQTIVDDTINNPFADQLQKDYNFGLWNTAIVSSDVADSLQANFAADSKDRPQVYPIISRKGVKHSVLKDVLVVKFHKKTPVDTIQKIFKELEIQKDIVSSNDKYKRYEIRMDYSKLITISQKLTEEYKVQYAHPDFLYGVMKDDSSADPLDPSDIQDYHHAFLKTQSHFDNGNYGSRDISIGVIDDGFLLNHQEFYKKNIAQYHDSSLNNDAGVITQNDSHGTAMAGAAVGIASDNNGVHGTCPECGLTAIKVSQSTAALARLIWEDTTKISEVAIISMSISFYDYESDIIEALKTLHQNGRDGKGVLIFKSIGNSPTTLTDTMDLKLKDFVLTISGSSNADHYLPDYSKCESCISFVSPAHVITAPTIDRSNLTSTDQYHFASNTSGATAVAAGVAGLVLSKDQSLTASELKNKLISNVKRIGYHPFYNRTIQYSGSDLYSKETGYGRISAGLSNQLVTAPQ